MKNTIAKVLVILLFICFFAIFIMCVVFDSKLHLDPIDNERYMVLEDGWTIRFNDGLPYESSLPTYVEGPMKGAVVRLSRLLPEAIPSDMDCLSILTGLSSVDVFVDDVPIYHFGAEGTPWLLPFYGGDAPHYITLPKDAGGKPLELVMTYSSSNPLASSLDAPILANRLSAFFHYLNREWISLILGYTFCFVGLCSLGTALFIKLKEERLSLASFGALELVLGIWVFTQGRSKFLFFRNPAVPMDFSILAMFLLPVFIALLMLHVYRVGKVGKTLLYVSYLFPLSFCIIGLLQLYGVTQYWDCVMIAGAALVLYVLCVYIVAIYLYCHKVKRLLSFALALTCLFVSIVMEEILLLIGYTLDTTTPLHVGMALCGGILLAQLVMNLRNSSRARMKESMLMEIAYSDALTGFGNRAAYDMMLADLQKQSSGTVGILMMDINDFKAVNDLFGHEAGDVVLNKFSKLLRSLLPQKAEVYRIGGDEFLVFVPRCDHAQIRSLAGDIEVFFKDLQQLGNSVAVGYSLYVADGSVSLKNAVRMADDNMYANKARSKG